ncbi:MAG: DoxX family membrane protein, partial [Flavobacteriaceae bacterium]|nr:DoxX family membrane protein [Flavobacteriaceae bacterium]
MKYLVQLIRILVGFSFVSSGFLKMIDPLGTSYKMEEYFSASVLNLEFLVPYALIIGIFLILIETVLGFFLMIGFKTKWTIWGLFLMIFLFLFLTWYSAYFNKVNDCGCFGDA